VTLGAPAATAVVGSVAVAVVAWGAWLSIGSSRRGPAWAQRVLTGWRPLPWTIGVGGAAAALVVEPAWMGLGVAYIAVVTGWLMRTVRRNLEAVREAYGGFDPIAPAPISGRIATYLLGGAAVVGALAVWDIWARGWGGLFTFALAVCLAATGLFLRRAA
jgi:hypothetical protein